MRDLDRGSARTLSSWTAAEIRAAEYLAQAIRNQLANELKRSREHEELIRRMALYDHLTGLPNRELLMDRLRGAIERVKRCHQAFAVCFLDLDKFKPIDDRFGHLEGDGALKAVATRLCGVLRQRDTLARVGGDELVVLIEEIDGESAEEVRAAATVVHKVIRSLDEPILVGTRRHRLGASVGVCCYPEIRGEPDALLHIADTAMYVGKKGGSNPTFAEACGDH
jgi:diguanylate cyclase (GGDEF)-like protein